MKRPRLGYVDGLRALAALTVVLSHVTLEVWPRPIPAAMMAAAANPYFYGHAAVSVFIVLSGCSLMLPVTRHHDRLPHGAWGFYWRRARRILPPYYAAIAFALTVIWLFIGDTATNPAWQTRAAFDWRAIIEHVLLIHDFSHAHLDAINPSFWSIAVECQIYLLFPALLILWRRYGALFTASVTTLLSCVAMVALAPTWVGSTPGYPMTAFAPQYIGLFAMGMYAARLITRTASHASAATASRWMVATIVGVGLLVILPSYPGHLPIPVIDPLTGAVTVAVLVTAAQPSRRNAMRAVLEWRPLVWIGGFSYSLYLIHAPLLQLLWQYALHPLGLSDDATYLLLLLIGVPLITLAAWGFWWLCERPFLTSRLKLPATAPAIGQERAAGHLSGGSEVARPLSVG